MNKYLRLCIVLAAGGLIFAQAPDKPDYAIKFDRPFVAGTKFIIVKTIKDVESMNATHQGKVIRAETKTLEVRFEAELAVLEATPAGELGKGTFTVGKFTADQGAGAQEILPAGTVVAAVSGGAVTEYRVNDAPLGDDQVKMLNLVVPENNGGKEDAVFATPVKRTAGECWPINGDKAVEFFNGDNIRCKKEDIAGNMCLEKAVTVNKTECLSLKGSLRINGIIIPNINLKSSEMNLALSGLLPVDGSKQWLESTVVMNLKFEGTIKPSDDDPEITVTGSSSRTVVEKYLEVRADK